MSNIYIMFTLSLYARLHLCNPKQRHTETETPIHESCRDVHVRENSTAQHSLTAWLTACFARPRILAGPTNVQALSHDATRTQRANSTVCFVIFYPSCRLLVLCPTHTAPVSKDQVSDRRGGGRQQRIVFRRMLVRVDLSTLACAEL